MVRSVWMRMYSSYLIGRLLVWRFLGSNPSLSVTRVAPVIVVGGFSAFGGSFYGLECTLMCMCCRGTSLTVLGYEKRAEIMGI